MQSNEDLLNQIAVRLEQGDAAGVREGTEKAIAQKIFVADILNNGLVKGMSAIGVRFRNGDVYLPEVLIAARAMKTGMEIIKPLLAAAKVKSKGKILIGTVRGDLHDIGKNIVSMMLEGAGFQILDLGIDVSEDKFVSAVKEESPDIVALSALLTTTMMNMKEVISALEKAGMRGKVRVIVGGAPTSQSFAGQIGADGYAPDAASAVDAVTELLRYNN